MKGKTAYVLADIEGSTGVWTKAQTQKGRPWQEARVALTEDLNAVAQALFERGAGRIILKDWHRTGFNIIPSDLDPRIHLISGYYAGPAIGFGDLHGADFALFVGFHASSGNPQGFLPHTLTSRIAEIVVNGQRICEAELFASVLSRFRVPVCFFSGCPAACDEIKERMPWVVTYPLPKDPQIDSDPRLRNQYIQKMREGLRAKIHEIPDHPETLPLFAMAPPFDCQVYFHDEDQARRMNPWNFPQQGKSLLFHAASFPELYENLLKIAYFTRWTYRLRKVLLPLSRTLWRIQARKHL
jgi:D-amino peptidase